MGTALDGADKVIWQHVSKAFFFRKKRGGGSTFPSKRKNPRWSQTSDSMLFHVDSMFIIIQLKVT